MYQSPLYIITGYSGAGKTTVLRSLEDLGFFCIDNLPLDFLPTLALFLKQPHMHNQKVAIGIDVRTHSNMAQLSDVINQWNKSFSQIKIIFLRASLETLIKRFQETRRKHPLGDKRDLRDAIFYEQELLSIVQKNSDILLDTDALTIHELKHIVRNIFSSDSTVKIIVNFLSFGFKYGIPSESNFVYDVRSLPNPYFIPALKQLNGTDKQIKEYLMSHVEVQEYWKKLQDFVIFSLERAYKEGRFFVQIAIGCTGGKHRSVAFVEELMGLGLPYVQPLAKHRDIFKE